MFKYSTLLFKCFRIRCSNKSEYAIIIILTFFLIFNSNKLFSIGQQEPEYYHSNYYSFGNEEYINFNIFGEIESIEYFTQNNFEETNNINKNEYYYVLNLYEPITFTKGFEHNGTLTSVTVEAIQLLFVNNDILNRVDLDWGGHIIRGKLFFSEDNHYHTPIIMVVENVRING